MIMLNNKYALVTGASGGIGFSIAKRFLEEGAYVGAHYCTNKESVERLVAVAGKDRCKAFRADFSKTEEVFRLWEEFLSWSGTIDILVNNAGEAASVAPLEKLTEEAWDRMLQVNLKAPFFLSRAALDVMKQKKGGRIINISSVGVKFGGGRETIHYSASKAALEAITLSFAKAGAPYNVLVNAVRAGVTDTAFHKKIGRDKLSERAQLIPLKRLARPDEIAEAVLFLASDKSSFITGSILTASGGE